tara:strand:+ start:758 stop:952 length:195 start_codon:yes stop_codon:yes gene_type:complete
MHFKIGLSVLCGAGFPLTANCNFQAVVENCHPSGRDSAIEAVVEILGLKVNFGDFGFFAHDSFL